MENPQDKTSIAVCVATYGRPLGLIRLLDSLKMQVFIKCAEPDWKIVIVDNDSSAPNREYIENLVLTFSTDISYGVEPTRGIASARNAAVELAGNVDYVAFIDDDEVASENWLDELLSAMHTYKADVVSGPMLPLFEITPETWIVKGRFFERERHPTGTEIKYGTTGNVLISKACFPQHKKPFDEHLNLTGGSDTLFFRQIHEKGARFIWEDEAIVHEFVPPQRATKEYLFRRAKRFGNAIFLVEKLEKRSFFSRIFRLIKSAGHFVVGVVSLMPATIIRGRVGLVKSLCLINRAVGELLGIIGKSYEIYK